MWRLMRPRGAVQIQTRGRVSGMLSASEGKGHARIREERRVGQETERKRQ